MNIIKTQNKNLFYSLLCAIITLLLSVENSVLAADIQIESYVQGGLTLVANGKWGSSMPFDQINLPMGGDISRQWFSNSNQDYLDYIDDTGTAGFYLKWKMTNFSYNGWAEYQGPISTNNFKLFAKHNGTTASALTKGYDDATKNLSILPNSCGSATVDLFTFHSNFTDIVENYSLTGTVTDQTLVTSTVNCLNIGHIRFDMAQLTVPQASEAGTYTSTLTWTIVDGLP